MQLSRALADLATYTRPSAAMYVGRDGAQRYASHNLLAYSEDLAQSVWTKPGVTLATDSAAALDGTQTADLVTESGGASGIYQVTGGAALTAYTASCFIRRGGCRWVRLALYNAADVGRAVRAWVDLNNGALGTVDVLGGFSGQSAAIQALADGWFRVTVTGTTDSGVASLRAMVNSADADGSSTRDPAGSYYLWGLQLELNASAGDYVRTTAVAPVYAPRVDFAPRVNLLQSSQQLAGLGWYNGGSAADNVEPAPDGTVTATRITMDTLGFLASHYQIVTVRPGQTYTFSFFAKLGTLPANEARFAVRNDSAGAFIATDVLMTGINTSSWVRVSYTFAAPAGCTTVRAYYYRRTAQGIGTMFVWGAQLEEGATATEYMANGSVVVPRWGVDASRLGWLIEAASTNAVRNSAGAGVVGSGFPTNWGATSGTGLTAAVVGTGTEAGLPYVDVRISGTSAGTAGRLWFEANNAVAAVSGQTWTHSLYMRVVAGSLSNVSAFVMEAREHAAGVLGTTASGASFLPSALPGRYSGGGTLVDAGTTHVQPSVRVAYGTGAVDVTLRLSCSQLEQLPQPTSPIVTSGQAVTRAADSLAAPLDEAWFNFGVPRTNLFLFSDQFDNAAWSKSAANVQADAAVGPDGAALADKIVPLATTAAHGVSQSAPVVAGRFYTFSVFAKAAEFNILRLGFGAPGFGTGNTALYFNLTTAQADGWSQGAGSFATWGAEPVGSGWYRVWVTALCTTTGTAGISFNVGPTTGSATTGDGVGGVYLFGAQAEESPATLPLNLIGHDRAEYFAWSSNGAPSDVAFAHNVATAPDGSLTADKIVPSTGNGTHLGFRTLTGGAANAPIAYSLYLKAAGYNYARIGLTTGFASARYVVVNLAAGAIVSQDAGAGGAVADAGNGWWRVSLTNVIDADGGNYVCAVESMPTDTPGTFAGDGVSGALVWGAKAESGTVATEYVPLSAVVSPYIPTTTVSRTVRETGAGTLVVEGLLPRASPALNTLLHLDDGTQGERIALVVTDQNGGAQVLAQATTRSGNTLSASPGDMAPGVPFRVALAFDRSAAALCKDGGAVTALAPRHLPRGLTTLRVGSMPGANHANGYVRPVHYFPFRLTNVQLQAASVVGADLSAIAA